MTKRKTYRFRSGAIIEVSEYHDGAYGAPGKGRQEKQKPTTEQMQQVNALNKARLARHRLLEYFTPGDTFATLTYAVENRPPDMEKAKKDFAAAMRTIRKRYKGKEVPLRWMRNLEQGTKGAWHVHLIIKECGNTASILQEAWPYGGVYIEKLEKSKYYEPDMAKLAAYITKDERAREKKKDGTKGKPRIRQASFSSSRNMPLKKPKIKLLTRWRKEPQAKKGYYIAKNHEGINPVTGYRYRRYTMYRIRAEGKTPKTLKSLRGG